MVTHGYSLSPMTSKHDHDAVAAHQSASIDARHQHEHRDNGILQRAYAYSRESTSPLGPCVGHAGHAYTYIIYIHCHRISLMALVARRPATQSRGFRSPGRSFSKKGGLAGKRWYI